MYVHVHVHVHVCVCVCVCVCVFRDVTVQSGCLQSAHDTLQLVSRELSCLKRTCTHLLLFVNDQLETRIQLT